MPKYRMPDGEQLFVREIGQGQPVLVLSGLGMQSWQWLPYLWSLKNQFKFYIPDWRGFGGSKHCQIPTELDAIQNHWRDVEALINVLNLDQFILMGYSMGATTSMHGMQYGKLAEKIKAYLHIDQTPKIASDETWAFGLMGTKHSQVQTLLAKLAHFLKQQRQHQRINDLAVQDQKQLIGLWLDFIELQASDKISPKVFKLAFHLPKLNKHLFPILRIDYLSWYIETYLNQKEDYRDAVAQLKVPTTFFIGEQSTLYPSQGQLQVAHSVKNANYVLFHKSGHTPLITEPVKFSKEIARFLKSQVN